MKKKDLGLVLGFFAKKKWSSKLSVSLLFFVALPHPNLLRPRPCFPPFSISFPFSLSLSLLGFLLGDHLLRFSRSKVVLLVTQIPLFRLAPFSISIPHSKDCLQAPFFSLFIWCFFMHWFFDSLCFWWFSRIGMD